jgi:23S rRNA (adenine2503-C2)-methyltransferase
MNLSLLTETIKNEPSYRKEQIKRAVFVDGIEDWGEAQWLPKAMREKLAAQCSLTIDAEIFADDDGSAVKALIRLSDGRRIETVLMRHADGRNTVCVSCQVGCPMACAFCATGKMTLLRSLDPGEIIEQVLFFSRYLKKEGTRVSGVVFMGMGEPFSNYENVLEAVRMMNDHDGLNIGARHISISTCGIIDGINRLAEEQLQVNLAISLHAPNDATRRSIMPVARTHTIAELLEAIDAYIDKTHRKVMFEYLMIGDVNDKDEHAHELAELMKGRLCMINMIAYNSTGMFKSATKERMLYFKNILEQAGVAVTIRYRHGRQVKAACGQLVTRHDAFVLPSDVTG